MLKKLRPDDISKQALSHSLEHFNGLLAKSSTSLDDRLAALVVITKPVQSVVAQFKVDNPGADQWLPICLELWQERKQSMQAKFDRIAKKRQRKLMPKKGVDPFEMATKMTTAKPKQTQQQTATVATSSVVKGDASSSSSSVAVIKRLDLSSLKSNVILADETDTKSAERKPAMKRLIVDAFFLGDGQAPPSPPPNDKPDEEDLESVEPKKKRPNFAPKPRASFGKLKSFKPNMQPTASSSSMHPSWQAKKVAKETQKINFDQLPKANKRITFS